MPGARCTRGLVCKLHKENAHTSIQVQRRQSGIPCAMALRLMPCSPRRANSSCHRRCRLDSASDPVGSIPPPTAWHQQRVSGPHGFAVRFSAVRPARRYRSRETRPATPFRADAAASTASPPAFVTTRDRPSCRERTGRAGSADLPDGERGIFFTARLDRFLLICPSGAVGKAAHPRSAPIRQPAAKALTSRYRGRKSLRIPTSTEIT